MRHLGSSVVPVRVVLWGTPLDRAYRGLFRELEVYSARARYVVAHRHYGFDVSDEGPMLAAELIEVATRLGRRYQALRWFVAHGRDGLVPAETLARELGVEPELFLREFFGGESSHAVERDLDEGWLRGLPSAPAAIVGESVPLIDPTAQGVLSIVQAQP